MEIIILRNECVCLCDWLISIIFFLSNFVVFFYFANNCFFLFCSKVTNDRSYLNIFYGYWRIYGHFVHARRNTIRRCRLTILWKWVCDWKKNEVKNSLPNHQKPNNQKIENRYNFVRFNWKQKITITKTIDVEIFINWWYYMNCEPKSEILFLVNFNN